ncbi:MAG TPA: heme exporter protein CcmD, partial [Methylococcaceae bacterium]|nr:heme exporter protein CcmD [Methylococcaceae bacterium]
MGGYAFYVWISYGLALLVLLANFIGAWNRHREARQRADRPT